MPACFTRNQLYRIAILDMIHGVACESGILPLLEPFVAKHLRVIRVHPLVKVECEYVHYLVDLLRMLEAPLSDVSEIPVLVSFHAIPMYNQQILE